MIGNRMVRVPFFPAVIAALMLAVPAWAASVSARLTSEHTSVGLPVTLQVIVDGTTNAFAPRDIEADGLRIQLAGQSTRVSVINGRMTTSRVYSYQVMPTKEGTLEIPAIEVTVDDSSQKTQPLRLEVSPGTPPSRRPAPAPSVPAPPGGGQPSQSGQQTTPDPDARMAFAEIILPKDSLYAGEIIPIEVRFYFNQNYSFQLLEEEPRFSGEGFTVKKFTEGVRSEQVVDGTPYHVLTFKSALTAVKSGEMEIPSITLHVLARIPVEGPAGFENLFNQFFRNSPVPGFTEDRELAVSTDPRTIPVKALPKENRPKDFGGAIGEFSISARATPEKTGPGDPVTWTVDITGRGNFDAMAGPTLVDDEGWRTYPPAETFEADDPVGYGGTKSFEYQIIAQEPQTQTPVAEFSYFDPNTEKYVTVKTEPIKVEAEGSSQPVAAASGESGSTPAPTASPTPGIEHLAKKHARSFTPLVRKTEFLVANGVALLILVGVVLFMLVRKARQGEGARRSRMARERNSAIGGLRNARLSDDEFLDGACKAVKLQSELAGYGDSTSWVRAMEPDGGPLTDLLASANERKFSGGLAVRVSPEDRSRITAALEAARK